MVEENIEPNRPGCHPQAPREALMLENFLKFSLALEIF